MNKHLAVFSFCCCAILLAVTPVYAAAKPQPPVFPRIGDNMTTPRFTQTIEDLPLMNGLEIIEDKDVLFVSGQHRIAQTTAQGLVDIDNVYYFYQAALPQLGWHQINARKYERNNEVLHVDASSANKDGITYVTFEIEPK